MVGDYFDDVMVNRQRLIWTVATRRQLERWEPYVAAAVRADVGGVRTVLSSAELWAAATEHHFALVAAHHLLKALELEPPSIVTPDPAIRAELIDGRHVHEHWDEYMAVFNTRPPRVKQLGRSGRAFAARNPNATPFIWLRWSSTGGAELLPKVSAPDLHHLLDAVESEVLADDPTLSEYVPPREPSPWLYENGEWWPTADHPVGR